jgi:hypothetical protein
MYFDQKNLISQRSHRFVFAGGRLNGGRVLNEQRPFTKEMLTPFLLAEILASADEEPQCKTCTRSVLYVRFNSRAFASNGTDVCANLFLERDEAIRCDQIISVSFPQILDLLQGGATARDICVNLSQCPAPVIQLVPEHLKSQSRLQVYFARHFDLERIVRIGNLIAKRSKSACIYVSSECKRTWAWTCKTKTQVQGAVKSWIEKVNKK